jgi:heterodisulfide reductase subunit D
MSEEFVQEWRNAAYNCYSSGHKFCREVCPVMQVERNESWTPTAFHANIVAMEKGELSVEDVAADYINCTQCGACELRCPNTLFTGDFYRFRTRTVDLVKGVRALAVDQGIHQPGWQRWNALTDDRRHEPVLGEADGGIPIDQAHVADWAADLDIPIGGETVLFVDCEAAFYRTSVPRAVAQILRLAGYEFGLMREQWCCGGPAAEMGYVEQAKRFARHNLDDWRAVGVKRVIVLDPHDYIAFTEDYPKYFGEEYDDIEIVLAVELFADLIREGRLTPSVPDRASDHLPRPVPFEQAQGDLGRAAGDPALHPRPGLPRRRPGDAVVLLLGGRRGTSVEKPELTAKISDRRLGQAASSRWTPWSAPARGPSGRWPRPATAARSTWWTSTSCSPSRSASRWAGGAGA